MPIVLKSAIWCLLACAPGALSSSAPAHSQEPAPPSVETLEAQLELMFEAAVAASDGDAEPLQVLQAWGTVMMSATMLERRRAIEAGVDASDSGAAASDAILSRWQELRPEHGGPHVMRLLANQDRRQRAEELLTLLPRFPDDGLVVWQTGQTLRALGEVEQATRILEDYGLRHPQSPRAHALLAEHYSALDNTTRQAEVLRRWAELSVGDATVVNRWLSAGLDRAEPEATAVIVDRFLASSPEGPEALTACRRLAKLAGPFRERGRDCVARIASTPNDDPALGMQAAEAMTELAAADGDTAGVIEHLGTLEPQAQVRALITSARALEVPEQCSERIELLRAASDRAERSQLSSIVSAARSCAGRPISQSLLLSLLETAPTSEVFRLVSSWVIKVNGTYRGELPSATAQALEARLAADPDAVELYRALDVVYQLEGDGERQYDLLSRWRARAADSMRSEQVVTLARQLALRGELLPAFELLESRLRDHFATEEAELLWQLLALPESGADGNADQEDAWQNALLRADRFAAELIGSSRPLQAAYGHLLAARGALAREDVASAEVHYLDALRSVEYPRHEWAVEMLTALSSWNVESDSPHRSPEQLATLAAEICEQSRLKEQHRGSEQCARKLLLDSDNVEALDQLAFSGRDLPASPRALERLGFEAQSAGDEQLAERAWRRLVEVDPRDPDAWVHLGVFLQKAGRLEDVEALLENARRDLPQPPVDLLRAVGRARLARGQAAHAIEVLQEARAALPEGHDASWLESELRQAHALLGRQQPLADRVAARASEVPAAAGRSEAEPGASADLSDASAAELLAAGEALRLGSDGHYDPAAAQKLIARAAAAGDALAAYRLALVTGDAVHVSPSQREQVLAEATAGRAYAQYLVGTGALTGVAHVQDPATARRWLELAAAQGEPWAQHNLAYMTEAGVGSSADAAAARDGYRRAGELGNMSSLYDYARLALTPFARAEQCKSALEGLTQAASAGHPKAVAFVGKLLFYGRGQCVRSDQVAAQHWLERAAEAGDSGARYDLGLALLLTEAPVETAGRGLELLQDVAGLPDALAIETLYFVFGSGAFAPRDAARARALLIDAARLGSNGWLLLKREAGFPPFEQLLSTGRAKLETLAAAGDAEAEVMLASLLLEGPPGIGDAVGDPARGVSLARQAARAGDAWGMRLLASALQQGAGVGRDHSEGLRWLWLAAESGDGSAMYQRGLELLSGKRVEPDVEAGLEWLARAADLGHWHAVGELGRIHAEGRHGLPRDPERAAHWKRRRAELGDPEARGWLRANGYAPP